jgi:hypothetical protein
VVQADVLEEAGLVERAQRFRGLRRVEGVAALDRQVNTVPAPMRCRPSMRMSLTVKGANADCAQAGSASAEAKARVSRRRDKGRVIRNILLRNMVLGARTRRQRRGDDASRHQAQDVIVKRQAGQPRDQREPQVLADGHRAFAWGGRWPADKVIQQVTTVQDGIGSRLRMARLTDNRARKFRNQAAPPLA